MNKCVFIGNLTRDPEHQTVGSGISLCRFSIAVNRTFANANGERETDFINIVTWRGLADNCAKYLTKGSKVCVCGALQMRSYEDKDGNKRTTYEVVADDVEFITPKNATSADASGSSYAPRPQNGGAKTTGGLTPVDDDLPF